MTPTFTKIGGPGGYTVRVAGVTAGTVYKTYDRWWTTRYNDGTLGPGAATRIEAAWRLINS